MQWRQSKKAVDAKVVPLKGKRQDTEAPRRQRIAGLLVTHGDGIRRYLQRLMNAGSDVEDVLHEIVCRALEYKDFDRLENPAAFLYRCAHNIVVDNYRRRKSHSTYLERIQVPCEQPLHHVSALDYNELLAAFREALPELPLKRREVFLLRCREGLNNAEVAERMNISVRMVQKHMTKALAHFQRRMSPIDVPASRLGKPRAQASGEGSRQ